MEYIYAALLLHSAGKEITEENLKKVLESAGIEIDDAKVKALVSALEGINIEDAIKNAMTFMAAAPVATAPSEAAAPAEEEKKEEEEEKKEEEEKPSEEEAAAGLAALFG